MVYKGLFCKSYNPLALDQWKTQARSEDTLYSTWITMFGIYGKTETELELVYLLSRT